MSDFSRDLQSIVFDVLYANNTGTEFAYRVAREVKEAFLDKVDNAERT